MRLVCLLQDVFTGEVFMFLFACRENASPLWGKKTLGERCYGEIIITDITYHLEVSDCFIPLTPLRPCVFFIHL